MSVQQCLLITVLGIALVLVAGCTQPASSQQDNPETVAVNMTVPFGPIPVESTNGVNLAYEIELATRETAKPVVEKVEVIDPATGIILYTPDAEILKKTVMPASDPLPTAEEMAAGTLKNPVPRIFIWFQVSPDAVPDRLVHRITLNRSVNSLPLLTVTGGEVVVRKDLKPVVLASPVRGEGWFVIETTETTTHHFLAPVTMNGRTTVPQRFAQDWGYFDPVTGRAVSGNATLAKDFLGYGKELYAVADGTIADARDGLPDLEYSYNTPPVNLSTAAGNYVILDIGNEMYACYAHMIPGSIRVKKGDTVKEGQVIGLMGNSGNSDVPHLHFQIVTGAPSFFSGEGYPQVFRSFDLIAKMNMTLVEERSAQPDFSATKLFDEFGDYVVFLNEPVPQKEKLMENWAFIRV
jgi:hypothetical protein